MPSFGSLANVLAEGFLEWCQLVKLTKKKTVFKTSYKINHHKILQGFYWNYAAFLQLIQHRQLI